MKMTSTSPSMITSTSKSLIICLLMAESRLLPYLLLQLRVLDKKAYGIPFKTWIMTTKSPHFMKRKSLISIYLFLKTFADVKYFHS
jgi:hypothetical protein